MVTLLIKNISHRNFIFSIYSSIEQIRSDCLQKKSETILEPSVIPDRIYNSYQLDCLIYFLYYEVRASLIMYMRYPKPDRAENLCFSLGIYDYKFLIYTSVTRARESGFRIPSLVYG